jgi:hypothetical protein
MRMWSAQTCATLRQVTTHDAEVDMVMAWHQQGDLSAEGGMRI